MGPLTIETPGAYAAVSLSNRLERAGSAPRIEFGDGALAVALTVDESGLDRILRIIQQWLDDEEIGSTRLRLLDREFVLAV